MFSSSLAEAQAALAAGNIDRAKALLDTAWTHAKAKSQRKQAHDFGNTIQRAICEAWLAQA